MIDPKLKRYLEEKKRFETMAWRSPPWLDLVRYYARWKAFQTPGRTPLEDEIPWITFSAISFLERKLKRDMRVLEYGAGGSTVFFARRVQSVVTVEHEPLWGKKVEERLAACQLANCQLLIVPPQEDPTTIMKSPADPASFVSGAEQLRGFDFSEYVKTVAAFDDGWFDVVLIDGRARPSCFAHALPKVGKGGYIIWDNTERSHYSPAMSMAASGFSFFDFPGPSPYVDFFTRTSVWQRR